MSIKIQVRGPSPPCLFPKGTVCVLFRVPPKLYHRPLRGDITNKIGRINICGILLNGSVRETEREKERGREKGGGERENLGCIRGA